MLHRSWRISCSLEQELNITSMETFGVVVQRESIRYEYESVLSPRCLVAHKATPIIISRQVLLKGNHGEHLAQTQAFFKLPVQESSSLEEAWACSSDLSEDRAGFLKATMEQPSSRVKPSRKGEWASDWERCEDKRGHLASTLLVKIGDLFSSILSLSLFL